MSTPRTRTLCRLGAALLLVVICAVPVRADDEEKSAVRVVKTIDLRGYRVGAAPKGPRISVATDIIAAVDDATDWTVWNVDAAFDSGTWLPFEEPPLERDAISADSVVSILHTALGEGDAREQLDIEAADARIIVAGPEAAVSAALTNRDWALAGLAPSVRVDAILASAAPGEDERLRATGGVTLWPGRWTRVYLQHSETPCAVWWDLEVAEEALSTDPLAIGIREGAELYMRYHPGETVSVVEVWAGSVEHLELVKQDLSAIRNIPEANGLGVVTYPKSGVNRVFSHILLKTGEASRHEVRWTNEGRSMRLRLACEAPPVAGSVLDRGAKNGMLLLRTGAVADELEFGARSGSTERYTEQMAGLLHAAAESYEKRGRAIEFGITAIDGGSVVLLDAPAAELPKAREVLVAAERELRTKTAALRVVAVPERAYRQGVLDGSVRVGRPVADALIAAWREAGATVTESITTSALVDASVGFRVGHTVPGITDLDAELAQRSGGLHPLTSARFAGLFGDLRIRRATGGHAVRVRGSLAWARSDAGTLEITVRPPVSMSGTKNDAAEAKPGQHLVKVPILGGGAAPVETEVTFAEGERREQLLHVHIRGDEVFLLLLALR